MRYTYVLYDRVSDRFYVGVTHDLKQRLDKHASGNTRTTRLMSEPRLAYYEVCAKKADASIREKQLKTGFGRGYLRRRLKTYLTGG